MLTPIVCTCFNDESKWMASLSASLNKSRLFLTKKQTNKNNIHAVIKFLLVLMVATKWQTEDIQSILSIKAGQLKTNS